MLKGKIETTFTILLFCKYGQVCVAASGANNPLTCKVKTSNLTTCVQKMNPECCGKRCYTDGRTTTYCSCGRENGDCLSDKDCCSYAPLCTEGKCQCKVKTSNLTTCVQKMNPECCGKRCYTDGKTTTYCSCGKENGDCLSDKDCCSYAQLCTQGKCQCARSGTKCSGKKKRFCCSEQCKKGKCDCGKEKSFCSSKADCCGTSIVCSNSTCTKCLSVNSKCGDPSTCCSGNCNGGQCKCNLINEKCIERSDCCPAEKGKRPIGCVRGFCKPCLLYTSEDNRDVQFGQLPSQCVGDFGADACCGSRCGKRLCQKGASGVYCNDSFDCDSSKCVSHTCVGSGCLPNGAKCGDPGQEPCCAGQCIQSLGSSVHKCK